MLLDPGSEFDKVGEGPHALRMAAPGATATNSWPHARHASAGFVAKSSSPPRTRAPADPVESFLPSRRSDPVLLDFVLERSAIYRMREKASSRRSGAFFFRHVFRVAYRWRAPLRKATMEPKCESTSSGSNREVIVAPP